MERQINSCGDIQNKIRNSYLAIGLSMGGMVGALFGIWDEGRKGSRAIRGLLECIDYYRPISVGTRDVDNDGFTDVIINSKTGEFIFYQDKDGKYSWEINRRRQ